MAARQQDDLAVAQNGGLISQDNTEDGDLDGDEGDLDDDDMMDKISSSPSIDDGGSSIYHLPTLRMPRHHCVSPCSSPASACFSEARSSSPYLDQPDYLPLQLPPRQADKSPAAAFPRRHHHLPDSFPECLDAQAGNVNTTTEEREQETVRSRSPSYLQGPGHSLPDMENSTQNTKVVLPEGEPASQEAFEAKQSGVDEAIEMEDEVCSTDDLIVPYEGSLDEDDDDDNFLEFHDPRFIDSGWGGECLHDTEDIDFELVYALHTFIATVEGQANATKGDAMVLLDDSNSYWWLVRVVKDSSIGMMSPPAFCLRLGGWG